MSDAPVIEFRGVGVRFGPQTVLAGIDATLARLGQ